MRQSRAISHTSSVVLRQAVPLLDTSEFNSTLVKERLCLKSKELHLDRVSTGSGSDLVNHGSQKSSGNSMLITDEVATALCTDPIQERFSTFEAKLQGEIDAPKNHE